MAALSITAAHQELRFNSLECLPLWAITNNMRPIDEGEGIADSNSLLEPVRPLEGILLQRGELVVAHRQQALQGWLHSISHSDSACQMKVDMKVDMFCAWHGLSRLVGSAYMYSSETNCRQCQSLQTMLAVNAHMFVLLHGPKVVKAMCCADLSWQTDRHNYICTLLAASQQQLTCARINQHCSMYS